MPAGTNASTLARYVAVVMHGLRYMQSAVPVEKNCNKWLTW
ncbi:MAG: hypothetical protein U0796_06285 [Gemmatales bacterium]